MGNKVSFDFLQYANSSLVHHGGETCVQKSDWEQRTEPNPPTPGRNKAVFMLILIVVRLLVDS